MASPSPPTMGDLGRVVAETMNPDAQCHFRNTIWRFVPQPHAEPTRILVVSEPRKVLIKRVFTAIRRVDPNFIMHQAQLGPLLSIDYEELNALRRPRYDASEILHHIEFLRTSAGMIAPSGSGAGFDKGGSKSRDKNSVDEARDRDSDTCTVTRLAICHMAHVFPFWATSTEGNVKRTERAFQSMSMMLSAEDFQELLEMVEQVRGCEKPENLFALNPALHGLMDKAYVAFEVFKVGPCIEGHDDGPWEVTLKFHFMPVCLTQSASSPQALEDAMEILDDLFDQAHKDGLPARDPPVYRYAEGYIGARLKSGEWLRSGHLFPITHPNKKSAELCAVFFRWQWACARIWCISGGAEPQELRGGNDDDDDGWKLPVRGSTDDLQQDMDADAGGPLLGPAPPPVASPASARPAQKLPQVRASGTPPLRSDSPAPATPRPARKFPQLRASGTPPLRSDSPAPATPRPARKFPLFRPSRSPVSPPRDSPSPDFSSPSRKGGFREFFRRFSKVPQPGGLMEAPEPGRGPPTPAPMDGEHHGGGTIGRVSTQIRRRVSDIFGKSREDVPGENA